MGLTVKMDNIRNKIHLLEEDGKRYAEFSTKKDALYMVKVYRQNVRKNKFPIPPLKAATIKRKTRMGYKKPESPLYGLGLEGTNTLTSRLRVYKIQGGWRVRMPEVKHHSSKLTAAKLLSIHENGCTFYRNGRATRIPARPVLAMAYREAIRHAKEGKNSKMFEKFVAQKLNGETVLEKRVMAECASMEAEFGAAH